MRPEDPADHAAIDAVNRAAFAGDEEVALIRRLRAADLVIASLVASLVAGDAVIGHILFSRLPVEAKGSTIAAASLAPLAVIPASQRRAIGSMLVTEGLNQCRAQAVDLVVVLGQADYYPRFGFSAALARRLHAPFKGDAFMAPDLTDGVRDERTATVHYPPAFGIPDQWKIGLRKSGVTCRAYPANQDQRHRYRRTTHTVD